MATGFAMLLKNEMANRDFDFPRQHSTQMTALGFEPTPSPNGALSHRLEPLGQTVFPHPVWQLRQ
jgi:hypothetical protein